MQSRLEHWRQTFGDEVLGMDEVAEQLYGGVAWGRCAHSAHRFFRRSHTPPDW